MDQKAKPQIDVAYLVEQWSNMNKYWVLMSHCKNLTAAERKAAEMKQYNAPTRVVKVTTTTVREVLE